MTGLLLAGAAAGLVMGYVLQRGQLCFHAAFRGVLERRTATFKAWALAAAVGAVGLALLDLFGPAEMSASLALRPIPNVVGGLTFGIGMAIAASCVSGLFYKLGAGMLGALVGLVAWGGGEVLADRIALPGARLLEGRETLPTLLGLPRLAVAIVVAGVAIASLLLRRTRAATESGSPAWRWTWPVAGVALGAALTLSWLTAGLSGTSFGASTSGAVASIVDGAPAWWRLAFLIALIPGATIAARTAGGWWVRGEVGVRYAQLALGGALMGAGARWAGGCNLGHALSGTAQLNLSSLLVVSAMIAGIALTRAARTQLGDQRHLDDPAYRTLTGEATAAGDDD